MRIRLILGIVFALIAVACSSGTMPEADPTTTSTSTAATEATTASTDAPAPTTLVTEETATSADGTVLVDVSQCGDDTEFDVFCEAYHVLTTHFVDDLDDADLAAGATRGIEELLDAAAGDSDVSTFSCPIPSVAFAQTCEAAAEALSSFDTDVLTVAEAAVIGLFEYGIDDPNSRYLPPTVLERISEEHTGTISGIGALVVTEEETDGERIRCNVITDTCRMSVVSVIEGGPAEAAGVQSHDIMVTVDGESIVGWTSEEIVAVVRGPEGEPVTIEMEREGEIVTFTIVRAPIIIPVTRTELYDNGVGYVQITQFTNNSGQLFREALQEVIDAGSTKLIIDFQNNPGGALNAAISVASEFLDEGSVLITQSPEEDTNYPINAGGVANSDDLEILVLVNRGSASASEVVAGVLQETGRAVVLGENTFGKNTVQQQYGLSNGGAVKVTIARWVTPDGADFGGDGVTPDIIHEIPADETTQYLIDIALEYFRVTS
jgi:carboxyl-terminal processing protease